MVDTEDDSDTYLRDESPDDAEPPELESKEDCAEDVAEAAREHVTNNVLYGVTWQICKIDRHKKMN